MNEVSNTKSNSSLSDIAKLFFKLGCVGFGGPAVHIAMMEEELVKKRKWISGEHFLDLVGATNLIPGPNSTEMSMHCGQERAGWKGLVVAGVCFILPAVVITGILAWGYQKYGELADVQPFLYGIKPAIISVIVALMISLGSRALKSVMLGVLGAVAATLTLLGLNEIYVLFGAGFVGIIFYYITRQPQTMNGFAPGILLMTQAAELTNWKILVIFLKVGSILYGSGYVLFAFLDAELVMKGWLSKQQLIDAIAVGQFTPGPVFSAATFIGWQLGGFWGALAATVGIFLPSFLFVAFLNPLIPLLRRSKVMSAFLDAVNIVSVAVILAVAVEMGKQTFLDWRTVVIAILGFVITFYFRKLNSAFVVLGGGILGYILWWF